MIIEAIRVLRQDGLFGFKKVWTENLIKILYGIAEKWYMYQDDL